MTAERDCLRRFVFERLAIRGELVHLNASWQAVLERRDYPAPVQQLLGEALAAAALLYATLKFDGLMTLQIEASGPLTLLVVQCTHQGQLRGLARWQNDIKAGPLQELCGDGSLLLTIEPSDGGERYQGVVALEGDSLSTALERYFERSEQLLTHLHLAADPSCAAGLLLQQLPESGHHLSDERDNDAWNRIQHLSATLANKELQQLDSATLIRRLFHQDDVRLFQPQPVSFHCTCSRERTSAMLIGLGYDEIKSIVAEQQQVVVNCEFCGQQYVFDAVDAEGLFAAVAQPDVPPTRH